MAIVNEISQFLSIDFQLGNLWDFEIIDNPVNVSTLNNISGQELAKDVNAVITNTEDFLMKFRIQTSSLPTPELSAIASKIGKKYYNTREYEGDYQITVFEDTQWTCWNYFNDWMNLIYNFDTQQWKQNPPNRTGILTYYDGSLSVPTMVFIYENLKVIGISDIAQNRDAVTPLTLTVKLTFDKMSYANTTSLAGQLKDASLLAITNAIVK